MEDDLKKELIPTFSHILLNSNFSKYLTSIIYILYYNSAYYSTFVLTFIQKFYIIFAD